MDAQVNVNRTVPDVLLVRVPARFVEPLLTAIVPVVLAMAGAEPRPAMPAKRLRAVLSFAAAFEGMMLESMPSVPPVMSKPLASMLMS